MELELYKFYSIDDLEKITESNYKMKKHNAKQGIEIVESPSHYHSRVSLKKMQYIIDRIVKRGYIEAIDVIDAWNLNFNLGSALKYELRLGEKDDEITEIDKAIQYLQFEKEMRMSERN